MMGEPYLNDVPIKEAFPKAEHIVATVVALTGLTALVTGGLHQ